MTGLRSLSEIQTHMQFKINRIHHGWSVEIGKSQPEGPPVPVGNEARRVSHRNGGPEGWDFPFSTDHTCSIFFSYIPRLSLNSFYR